MKYLAKTIEYGLYLLVFLLPIQTRWIIKAGVLNGGPWEYGTYSLYGTDILLIIVLLLFVIHTVRSRIAGHRARNASLARRAGTRNDNNPLNPPLEGGQINTTRNDRMLHWFIGGLVLISAVSVFFAASKPLALYKLGWLILGIGLFWLIVSASYNRLKLIYAIIFGLFFQAFLGIWQFLTQSSFANKWLGMASHDGANLGVSVIETIGADGIGERWLRAYAGLDHPNILGGIMAVGILMIIWQIIGIERVNNFQTIFNDKILKYINSLLLIIFTAALFFSFSRAAWLGLAAGLMVLLFGAVIKKDWLAQKNILQTILISGAVIFILFLQYPNLAMTRLYAGDRLEVKSTNERVESIKNSRLIIKNNWLFGAGLGNYTLALSRQMPGQEIFYYQPAHNVFLLALAETGVMGFIFFIGLLFVVVSDRRGRGKLVYSDDNRRLLRSLLLPRNDSIILIALVVVMSFDHWPWSLHFGVLFFWLMMGLAASEKRDENSGFPLSRE